jgi:hypothetical protein
MVPPRLRAAYAPLAAVLVACGAAPAAAPSAPCSSAPAPRETVAASAAPPPDAGAEPSRPFDPAPWLEDLDALTDAMSSHYANLDFATHERRLDLARVKKRAQDRLRAATSTDDARRAFRRFLNSFGDAHLDIDWTPAAATTGEAPKKTGGLCARLGYEDHDRGGIDFTLVPGFTPIADADARDVPGGVLELAHAGKIGVVRIDLFMETVHPALCEAARGALGLADDAACDEKCEERVGVEVGNRLTEALARRAVSLEHAGAQAIAVDITGNGGGSDWVDPATRTLTPVKLESRPMGAVRHAHWVKEIEERIESLKADLAAHGDVEHGAIAAALAKLDAELTAVKTPCDHSGLWTGTASEAACSQLVPIEPVLAYAAPGALDGRADVDVLFGPARYRYKEGVTTLPLAVLVDAGTASAAEHFAEMLQDHHAATILGAQTIGAGCGYTNGGIPTVLPRSGARVKMPDCARLRADGSNAVAGVTPDVVLPLLDRDSPYQRARKAAEGLGAAWKAILAKRPKHAPAALTGPAPTAPPQRSSRSPARPPASR